jgi:heavy metal sensor kinase
MLPADRLRAAMTLPGSLLDGPDASPHDGPYIKIWRFDGTVLAESDNLAPAASGERRPEVPQIGSPPGLPPGFRWREPDRREIVVNGPRGSTILVGKPFGRELAEMRRLAWRLFGGGVLVMVVGLAGGWFISRSITQPIQSIAATASEISAHNLARRIETAGLDKELVGLATILNEMFGRLESAFDRQSRFTSDASHELRTPLAVLHAHAELALSRPRSAEEYRETLAACLKAAARMGTLVDGLLMLARADAGRLDPQFRRLDWREVVDDVVEQYRPQATAADIRLSTDLTMSVPVRGDAALLARVSSNLLANALRYTPKGGRVHVALSAKGSDGAVLAVEDSGCGIAVEDQPHVFERFFRADKARSRSQGGNGLGLAICKSLVEAHYGRIGFTSLPEQGTRFEVCLPLDAEGDPAATAKQPPSGAASPA